MQLCFLTVRHLVTATCWLHMATAAWAAEAVPVLPSSLGSDRAGIAAQRQAIEQAAQAQALACQSRFAVTACLEQVRAQQREALAPWRERELQLNEDSRRDRATARREAQQRRGLASAADAAQPPTADNPPRQPLIVPVPEPVPTPGAASGAYAVQPLAQPLAQQPARPKPASARAAAAATKAASKRAAATQRVKDRVNKRLLERKKPADKTKQAG
jgi:colicin import membrane protein